MTSSPLDNTQKKRSLLDRFFTRMHRLPVSDAYLLKLALLALFGSVVWFLVALSTDTQTEVPARGGTFTEGIIGTPRFVNPVLAISRTDKDVDALVFDGLMKLGDAGTLVPNIAESVTVSDDGLTYNVVLRNNVVFHDGTPLTAADVIFTVGRIQEPTLASPLRTNFDGVVVEQLGEHEINFILPEPYTPFIENLTFGILPYHIWKDVSNEEFPFSQRNSEPIGTGPYRIEKIERTASGIPEAYILTPHASYHGDMPKIENVVFKFYANEEKLIAAFNKGAVDAVAAFDAESINELNLSGETHRIMESPLPRTFAIFLNQNKSAALRDTAARKALDMVIDREVLIDIALGGYGTPLHSPIPYGFGIDIPLESRSGTSSAIEDARAILKSAGWKINETTGIWEKKIQEEVVPLAFSIATANSSIFEVTAEFLQATWKQLGADVTIKQFEQSDLTQAIIRPRDYEALLFGNILNRSLDLYPFWHSSQRNDPGLNVALYANIETDAALEKTRTTLDENTRKEAFLTFHTEIQEESPALFLYSPKLLYIFPNKVTGAKFTGLAEPSERFASIQSWYIKTESVWPIFSTK